ncbi:MAG: hypothetical protein KTR25_01110 [Myxococcales bacterium]|nr:hypothetical protein [Myxococcales bacterium]
MIRVALLLTALVGIAVVGVFFLITAYSKTRPTTGDETKANAVLAEVHEALNMDAWRETGAIRWNFAGRQKHIWDRRRHLSQVSWGKYKVLQSLDRQTSLVYENGTLVEGEKARVARERAWAFFINDSFWLQPFDNLQQEGIRRSVVSWNGEDALFIEYLSGGLTPGDAYLWLIDKNTHLPHGWHMWVKILPIGGLWTSWEDWAALSTGAQIATKHKFPIFNLQITEIAAAPDIQSLENGQDPFAPLLNKDSGQPPAIATSQPTTGKPVSDDSTSP